MSRLKRPFYQPFLYWLAKSTCWLFYKFIWRLHVEGGDNIPATGSVILAANHRSFADPPLIGVATKRTVHFLAKEELFEFKPFGWLISNLNAHPLKRGGTDMAAFKTAKQILTNGEALIVFPEGRRSRKDEFSAPKAGVGMLAAMAECPVIPAYIHNSGHLKAFKRLGVSFGPPLFSKDYGSYQDLADAVMKEISRLKTELVSKKIC